MGGDHLSFWIHCWDQDNVLYQLEYVAHLPPGDRRLSHDAADGFRDLDVRVGGRIYVVGFQTNKAIVLLGGFKTAALGDLIRGADTDRAVFSPAEAAQVLDADRDELWDSDLHFLADDRRGSRLAMHHVFRPEDHEQIELIGAGGRRYPTPVYSFGAFDPSPYQRPQRITYKTAKLFGELIDWS